MALLVCDEGADTDNATARSARNSVWRVMRESVVVCLVFLDCAADAYPPLLAAAGERVGDLVALDADDIATLALLARHGFHVRRRERLYEIPTDPALTELRPVPLQALSARDADLDRLRRLDNELRRDVPGCAGWDADAAWFAAETFSDSFDPATYLVATDGDEYVVRAEVDETNTASNALMAALSARRVGGEVELSRGPGAGQD
jgi:hypothetical protein